MKRWQIRRRKTDQGSTFDVLRLFRNPINGAWFWTVLDKESDAGHKSRRAAVEHAVLKYGPQRPRKAI